MSKNSQDSIPRWRTEDIDEHVDEKILAYEAARETLEGEIRVLRDRIVELEAENERLKCMSETKKTDIPPEISPLILPQITPPIAILIGSFIFSLIVGGSIVLGAWLMAAKPRYHYETVTRKSGDYSHQVVIEVDTKTGESRLVQGGKR